ncbi:MAG: HAMP domain-containing histidine kinase [Clostridiales bacterium]|nr:HAMP domain-containing histidine kinase [Clostridiales bacterium]
MKLSRKTFLKRRLTTLPFLVLFVFLILVISIVFSGAVLYFLIQVEVFPIITTSRLSATLLFLFLVSIFIGTLLAAIIGDHLLKPLRKLTEATKQVALGNFDVELEASGTMETAQLATSFNRMTKELSSIESLRSDFVSNISHEFKTPVVSIGGFAKRLKKDPLTQRQSEYVDIIIAETERLSQLSQNVMLLSNLESSETLADTRDYFLDEQIRRCILLLEPLLDKERLDLNTELQPIEISSNEEVLNHLWINLLSNAIKFSPSGGTISITLEAYENHAQVTISDEGIGMDEVTVAHMFDKFYQGDASRATAGNGLGLSLVKRILSLSGGEIEVISAPNHGTSIRVALPKKVGVRQI